MRSLTLSQTSPGFYMSAVEVFENTVGKGEIACNEQFLLFPQCLLFGELSAIFIKFKIVVSANSLNLGESKICCLGKG